MSLPVFVVKQKAVSTPKLRSLVTFPANIVATQGISAEKSHGVWTFELDYTGFTDLPAAFDPSTFVVLTFDPVAGTYYAATLDSINGALHSKAAVAVATTANITLSGEQTIDGVTTSASRVLVKNQTTAANNGIYVSAAGAWTRATDLDVWSEAVGAYVFVSAGTLNGSTGWLSSAALGGIIGTTTMPWSQFSASTAYAAGSGLSLTGSTFSVPALGITNAMLAGSINAATKITGTLPDANLPSSMATKTFTGTTTLSGGTPKLDIVPSGSTSATVSVPRLVNILDGTTSSRVTTPATPTLLVSRYEGLTGGTTDGSGGPAIYGVNSGNGLDQPVGISGHAIAEVGATSDACGMYGVGENFGDPGRYAYGGFFLAQANVAGQSSIAVECAAVNNTGVDRPFGSGNCNSVNAYYISPTNNTGGAAFQAYAINPGVARWDCVIGVPTGDHVKTAFIIDGSSSTNMWTATGSHTGGLDWASATFSGNAIATPGFAVSGSGAASVKQVTQTSSPATAPLLASNNQAISIANGSSATIPITNGLVQVHEFTAVGDAAVYFVAGPTASLLVAAGSLWVSSTTTPAAGQCSIAYDGVSSIRIYNNRGGTSSFFVGQWQN